MANRLDRVQIASSLSSGTGTVSTWPIGLTRQTASSLSLGMGTVLTRPMGLTGYRPHLHYPQVQVLCLHGLQAWQGTDSILTIIRYGYCVYMAYRVDRVQTASSLSSGTGTVLTRPIGLTGYRPHLHYPQVKAQCLHGLKAWQGTTASSPSSGTDTVFTRGWQVRKLWIYVLTSLTGYRRQVRYCTV